MRTRNKVLAGLATVAIIAVGVVVYITQFKDSTKTYSWRYKMTVVVDTPEGEKSGSAVREIVAQVRPYPRDTQRPWRSLVKVKGEAVVVDLGERGVLFALTTPDDDNYAYQAFPYNGGKGGGETTPEGIKYYANLDAGLKAPLDPTRYPGYPQMVTFTDMNDPMTVKNLIERNWDKSQGQYPIRYEITNSHFEEYFGEGVKLKEITLEITDEPIAWGIEKYLPWVDDVGGGHLNGEFLGGGPELSNILHGGNFKLGEKQ